MKYLLLLICAFVIMQSLSAQQSTISGRLTDTLDHQKLTNSTITLIRAKDSVLYKFTRSGEDGKFQLNNIDSGKYILLITHNRYADYFEELSLNGTDNKELGSVVLTTEANLLQSVEVRTKIAAMRMRGDTLEFKADSFHVRENASVEDLLKILPGIQVDKDGNITAQGEKVQKVLVDGEEFFGNDPTVATQGLAANSIDKVQVFDKKSDQADFTGIDDGEKSKTINLTLKDDKKKGYFGKLDLGGGLDDKWNNSAMINMFRKKQKISAYGIMSSVGKTGLGWEDRNNYGSGNNLEYDEDNGYFYSYNDGGDFNNSSYYGQGIPKSWAAGLNYSNKFNDDKQNLNGSYRYNKITTTGSSSTNVQLLLPENQGGEQFTTDSSIGYNTRDRNSVNAIYEWKFDSSTSMKFTGSGYKGTSSVNNRSLGRTVNKNDSLINASDRRTTSDGDNGNINANLVFRKKFKKAGRTVSLNINEIYNESNSTGFLFADITRYVDGFLNDSITDQKKLNDSKTSMFSSKITYTEPLTKKLFAEVNYSFRQSSSNSQLLSYNKNGSGKYDDYSDSFSNHYKFDITTNTAGLSFKYNGKKITSGIGTDIAFAQFNQNDLIRDSLVVRNYTNFFPRANFVYKINNNSNIRFNYSGNTNQPNINQIQPVQNNNNPLVIYKGNPLLKQEFNHRLSLSANSYKVLKQSGFWASTDFSTTSNAIVSSQTTDTTGKTTYEYINTNGNYNASLYLSLFNKISKADLNLNYSINFNNSQYSSFVNNVKNKTNNYNAGAGIYVNKSKEKKYELNLSANVSYNYSSSSVNESLKTNYITQDYSLNGTYYLPLKLELNAEVNANLRQKTDVFNKNNNVVLVNGYLGKKFLKADKGLLKFSVYDLLNQNKGYDRSINTNAITENRYQTLRRYFLLSFVWNFSKSPAGVAPQGQ